MSTLDCRHSVFKIFPALYCNRDTSTGKSVFTHRWF